MGSSPSANRIATCRNLGRQLACQRMPDATAIPPFLDRLRGPGYAGPQRDYVAKALFMATDDAGRKARILDDMAAAPQHVMVSARGRDWLRRAAPVIVLP